MVSELVRTFHTASALAADDAMLGLPGAPVIAGTGAPGMEGRPHEQLYARPDAFPGAALPGRPIWTWQARRLTHGWDIGKVDCNQQFGLGASVYKVDTV
jgi:hypothetical protein